MNRRSFLKTAGGTLASITTLGLIGCGKETATQIQPAIRGLRSNTVELYDTYAMAMYFDGTMGPKTGIIKVDYIIAGRPVAMEFWHGHGGRKHTYILTPTHMEQLKRLERVTLETDSVASHQHKLFIEPNDPRYRVPGAVPIQVELG